MRKTVGLAFVALLLSFPVFAQQVPFDLNTTGDHSVWVITNDVKAQFSKETGLTLNLIPELAIVGKGCEKGLGHATKGVAERDIGLICCTLDTRELAAAGLVTYAFAAEPLAIIVNPRNPVKSLTLEQLRGIFSGRITNWEQVGGAAGTIVVATQLHCAKLEPNWKRLLPDAKEFTTARVDVKSQPEMAKLVADFPNAIGHLEMTSVVENAALAPVKLLAVNGQAPTTENVAKGFYPLIGELSVLTKGPASPNAMRFVRFLRESPAVQTAMTRYGMAQRK